MRGRALTRSPVSVIVMVLSVASRGNDTSGSVTIEAAPDFDVRPAVGTFEVTEGAEILGCSGGTLEESGDFGDLRVLMTCAEGDSGTFTIAVDPDGYDTGSGEHNGPWRIVDATSEFAGLQGEGHWWLISGVERYTGDIEHTPRSVAHIARIRQEPTSDIPGCLGLLIDVGKDL